MTKPIDQAAPVQEIRQKRKKLGEQYGALVIEAQKLDAARASGPPEQHLTEHAKLVRDTFRTLLNGYLPTDDVASRSGAEVESQIIAYEAADRFLARKEELAMYAAGTQRVKELQSTWAKGAKLYVLAAVRAATCENRANEIFHVELCGVGVLDFPLSRHLVDRGLFGSSQHHDGPLHELLTLAREQGVVTQAEIDAEIRLTVKAFSN